MIAENKVTDKGMRELFAFSFWPSLQRLQMSENHIECCSGFDYGNYPKLESLAIGIRSLNFRFFSTKIKWSVDFDEILNIGFAGICG